MSKEKYQVMFWSQMEAKYVYYPSNIFHSTCILILKFKGLSCTCTCIQFYNYFFESHTSQKLTEYTTLQILT